MVDSALCVQTSLRPSNDQRLIDLNEFFFEEFNIEPEFFVKVPGRVNLIGEHVDYCGYPVLPMAIEQNILLAVAPSLDEKIVLRNFNAKYDSFECDIDSITLELKKDNGPQWYKYFLCGVKGITDKITDNIPQTGVLVAVSGNIPPAAGLSSSSALVSAATLATSYVNKLTLNKQHLSTISAECERYIGTQGGGMDQAIAFLAKKGCAQFIDWQPLTATPVTLPENATFVIANSLAEANKAATSDYNQRVVECRIGCSILAKKEGLAEWKTTLRFAELQKKLAYSLEAVEALVDKHLPKHSYSVEAILNELEINEDDLAKLFLSENTKHLQEFKLRQRALHVFQESIRVSKFRTISNNNGSIKELSDLMYQSHVSLQKQFECSHPKLDELVEISTKFGVGARLTGAGWGGCIVALCDSVESSAKYIQELKEQYYKKLPQLEGIDLDNVVFATSPQSGAEIYFDEY